MHEQDQPGFSADPFRYPLKQLEEFVPVSSDDRSILDLHLPDIHDGLLDVRKSRSLDVEGAYRLDVSPAFLLPSLDRSVFKYGVGVEVFSPYLQRMQSFRLIPV